MGRPRAGVAACVRLVGADGSAVWDLVARTGLQGGADGIAGRRPGAVAVRRTFRVGDGPAWHYVVARAGEGGSGARADRDILDANPRYRRAVFGPCLRHS